MSFIFKGILFILCIFFPWIAFFLMDRPGVGLICLVLQASIIGWIPASIWALKTLHSEIKEERKESTSQQQEQQS